MPDWPRLVAERLAAVDLAPDVRREVVAEIAAHLDECYTELRQAGVADAEAQTLAQVSDWKRLSRRIRRSKEDRMSFARKVVMPGIAAVIVAMAALRVLTSLLIVPVACEPRGSDATQDLITDATCIIVSADGPVYLPWLATLLFAGGLAAWLARRMGARPRQRLLAALSPAIYLFGDFVVRSLPHGFFWRVPVYWVLIPALVCAAGAAAFLGLRRDRLEPQPAAN